MMFMPMINTCMTAMLMNNTHYNNGVAFSLLQAMVLRALKDVRPTIFFAPTIFYEYLHRELELKLEQTSFFKRILTSWAMKIGRKGFDDQTRL